MGGAGYRTLTPPGGREPGGQARYNRDMLIRGLIVLLLVLNLGVALWWMLHAPPSAQAQTEPLAGVARLQLVSEAPLVPDPAPVEQCVAFGPFPDAATADAARARLAPQVVHGALHSRYAGAPLGWRVLLPPFATPAAAGAVAEAVREAGFEDYYVIRGGAEANALALGQFRGESSARERAKKLIAAGFPAHVEPVGAGPAEHWLEIAAAAGFDPARAQALVGAERLEPVDCRRFGGLPDPQP